MYLRQMEFSEIQREMTFISKANLFIQYVAMVLKCDLYFRVSLEVATF